jgi:hypothetical protein
MSGTAAFSGSIGSWTDLGSGVCNAHPAFEQDPDSNSVVETCNGTPVAIATGPKLDLQIVRLGDDSWQAIIFIHLVFGACLGLGNFSMFTVQTFINLAAPPTGTTITGDLTGAVSTDFTASFDLTLT